MDTTPEVFTIVEAARLLRVPEGWLRKKVTAHAVPHMRLGKHVRFTNDHLAAIVSQAECPAVSLATRPSGLSPRARRSCA